MVRLRRLAAIATLPLLLGTDPSTRAAGRTGDVRLTANVPPLVGRTCRALAGRTTLGVVCPPLVPRTRIVRSPGLYGFLSAEDIVAPGPSAPSAYYELSFNSGGPFGTIHWIVAKGSPRAVRFWVLGDTYHEVKGRPRRQGVLWVANRRIEIYRFPDHPAGGGFGSHLAALVRSGPVVYVASIHGYRDARASARMAVAMALKDSPR